MDQRIAAKIADTVNALKSLGAQEVYVFGSAATGRMRDASDVDVAVSGIPAERFLDAIGRAADALGRSVDLVDLDEDTPFTRYLRREGELRRVG